MTDDARRTTHDERRETRDEGQGDIEKQMHVIAVMWIVITLLVLSFIVWLTWPMLCERIAVTALEQAVKQLPAAR